MDESWKRDDSVAHSLVQILCFFSLGYAHENLPPKRSGMCLFFNCSNPNISITESAR